MSPTCCGATSCGGGSSSRASGMSRAAASAHIVSRLGLPVPVSSPDIVDFPIPARRATSDRDSPARSRSRFSAAAICWLGESTALGSSGGPGGESSCGSSSRRETIVFTIPANMFELTNVSAECTVWNMGSLFRTGERVLPGSTYRAVAIVTITIIAVALSYGAISAVSGFAWWQTLLLAMFALGGAAEFPFVGVIAAGGAPILAVLAGLLVNSRNFAFGIAVGPFFPQDWRALIASHWINDESTAISRTGRND